MTYFAIIILHTKILQYVNKQLTLYKNMLVKPKSVWLLDHSAEILWQLENLLKMLSSCETFVIVLFYSNKQLAVHEKILMISNTVMSTDSPFFILYQKEYL